jgi:hypothetical protein
MRASLCIFAEEGAGLKDAQLDSISVSRVYTVCDCVNVI